MLFEFSPWLFRTTIVLVVVWFTVFVVLGLPIGMPAFLGLSGTPL